MKIFFSVAVMALMAFACNLCNTSNSNNRNGSNSNSVATTSTPEATPSKPTLKDAFPAKVGDFSLDRTFERSKLEGDDKFVPDAEDVMGAIYKSGSKKEQVMAGMYSSASAAEAARAKRVPSSKYVARWTKGSILYVATDSTFKDKL